MKTRNGFVSNSSSSSFIVAYKKEDDKLEIPDTEKIKIIKRIAGWYDMDADEMLKEEDEWYCDSETKKKIQEFKDKGYGFAQVEVGYGGEGNLDMLDNKHVVQIASSD